MRIIYIVIILALLTLVTPVTATDQEPARQVLAEINLARTQPRFYANLLREFRKNYQGNYYMLKGSSTRIHTSEGVRAVDEAIKVLSALKPVPALTWSNGLAAAASELAEEQGRSGATGHGGSRGMQERIERQGTWRGQIGENIGYGPEKPRDMVMQLIIDDGVPNRGHRKNTFSTAFRTAGAAWGTHPNFGSMCVIDFAGGFSK